MDQEWTHRQNRRLARLLRQARLRLPACLEDIDYHHPRGLDRSLLRSLATGDWLRARQNVLITGPTDAILDRLVHNAHKIALRRESMRKMASQLQQSDQCAQ